MCVSYYRSHDDGALLLSFPPLTRAIEAERNTWVEAIEAAIAMKSGRTGMPALLESQIKKLTTIIAKMIKDMTTLSSVSNSAHGSSSSFVVTLFFWGLVGWLVFCFCFAKPSSHPLISFHFLFGSFCQLTTACSVCLPVLSCLHIHLVLACFSPPLLPLGSLSPSSFGVFFPAQFVGRGEGAKKITSLQNLTEQLVLELSDLPVIDKPGGTLQENALAGIGSTTVGVSAVESEVECVCMCACVLCVCVCV